MCPPTKLVQSFEFSLAIPSGFLQYILNYILTLCWALVAEMVKNLTAVPESPGEDNGCPLQYYCLDNSMNRGAWWAIVHGDSDLDTTEQLML